MPVKVKELKPGDRAVVLGFSGDNSVYRNKLLSMGVSKKTEIVIVKKAPLGDPVEIEVKGYRLTLRKDEAEILDLERV